MSVQSLLTLENPVFKAYLFYCSVLVLKILSMAVLTARQRFSKGIFASPEDAMGRKAKVGSHEDIERVRRAHLNDLENIPVFFVAAFVYLLTNPSPLLAINLFRAFTFARIAHTLVYAVVVVPQPARAIAFFVGYGVTLYMAIMSIRAFY